MIRPALHLWTGKTVHVRHAPFERRFEYDLVLIDVDIDRLDEAATVSPLLSINTPGLYSFQEKDHGPKSGGMSLRSWAEENFAKAGADLDGGAIRLVTFPRHFSYKFAPISLWFGYGPMGDLRGIVYEVNNTFGESHCYIARTGGNVTQHIAPKTFHVSPFFDVTGTYRFTLRAPDRKLSLIVENVKNGKCLHTATISARTRKVSTVNLLKHTFRNPLSTLGVTIAIHWQALKIWLKGVRYRKKPAPPNSDATFALPVSLSNDEDRKDAA